MSKLFKTENSFFLGPNLSAKAVRGCLVCPSMSSDVSSSLLKKDMEMPDGTYRRSCLFFFVHISRKTTRAMAKTIETSAAMNADL